MDKNSGEALRLGQDDSAVGVDGDETSPAVSVVVAVRERPEDLVELYERHAGPLRAAGYEFEFIFVAGPGYEELTEPARELSTGGARVRLLEVGQAIGAATAMKLGARYARAPVIVTLPAYRRVDPAGIPRLIQAVESGLDMAVARRWPREDSWINRFQNRVFHSLLRGLLGASLHDVASGVAALRTDVLLDLPLYGDLARFLPLLALREGYAVEEIPIEQDRADIRPRVYSPGIYLRRLLDVLALVFLLRFTEKPLRFFGLIGSALSLGGMVVLAILFVQRLGGQGIANRPLLLLGVLLLVVGFQAIALGLVGEIIVHLSAPNRSTYRLKAGTEERR